jgi:hypothetical protein
MKKTGVHMLVMMMFVLAVPAALAAEGPPPPMEGERNRPVPQFAVDACKGKAAGEACTAGKGKGACAYAPDGKTLACRPDVNGMPGAR